MNFTVFHRDKQNVCTNRNSESTLVLNMSVVREDDTILYAVSMLTYSHAQRQAALTLCQAICYLPTKSQTLRVFTTNKDCLHNNGS